MSKQEKMFRLVDEYRSSGSTIKGFCEKNDIKVTTFNYWKRKKDTGSSPGGFIKVHSELSTRADLELVYPNGVRLRTHASDLGLIKNLLYFFLTFLGYPLICTKLYA